MQLSNFKGRDMRSPESSWLSAVNSFFRSNLDLKELTTKSYAASLKRYEAAVGPEQISELSAEGVNSYLASVANKRYMARRDAAVLKLFAKWCVRARYLREDPLIAVATPRVPRWRPKPLPDSVVPAVITAAGKTKLGPRDRAIVLLEVATGARPNEVRQLRWPDDVDLRAGLIHIREETSKSPSGHRSIPLDSQVIAALDEYLSDTRPEGPGALFLNAGGRPFSYYGFLQIHYRLRDRLRAEGIAGYQAYRLRHTALTNFDRAGYSAFDVQQLAGHADMATTRRYVGQKSIAELQRLPSALTKVYGRVG